MGSDVPRAPFRQTNGQAVSGGGAVAKPKAPPPGIGIPYDPTRSWAGLGREIKDNWKHPVNALRDFHNFHEGVKDIKSDVKKLFTSHLSPEEQKMHDKAKQEYEHRGPKDDIKPNEPPSKPPDNVPVTPPDKPTFPDLTPTPKEDTAPITINIRGPGTSTGPPPRIHPKRRPKGHKHKHPTDGKSHGRIRYHS